MTRPRFVSTLLSQAQFFNNGTIPCDVVFLQVTEQISSVTYHFQQTASAVMVLVIPFQMLVEIIDTLGQNGNLYLGRTGVSLMRCICLDDLLFFFSGHFFHLFLIFPQTQHTAGEIVRWTLIPYSVTEGRAQLVVKRRFTHRTLYHKNCWL